MRTILLSLMLCAAELQAADYFVATNGNDSAAGTSTSAAWRTIQKAASLTSGSNVTIHILPGVYRESVVISNSGVRGAPFVFTAEAGVGSVQMYGSLSAAALVWNGISSTSFFPFLPSAATAHVFVTSLAGWPAAPRGVFQTISGDVRRLPPCRVPNWCSSDDWMAGQPGWYPSTAQWKYHERWWRADDSMPASSNFQFIRDATNDAGTQTGNLTTLPNLTNATARVFDGYGAFYEYGRTITNHQPASGYIAWAGAANAQGFQLTRHTRYYIEQHPACLDMPGEWYYDVLTSNLYIYTVEGISPALLDIEIPRYAMAFKLSGRRYIVIEGIGLQYYDINMLEPGGGGKLAGTIHAEQGTTGGNLTITNCRIAHVALGLNFWKYGGAASNTVIGNLLVSGCNIGPCDECALQLTGSSDVLADTSFRNVLITQNRIHDCGFYPHFRNQNGSSCNRFRYGMELLNVVNYTITSNHVWNCAHAGVRALWGRYATIADNLVEWCCNNGEDTGGINVWNGLDTNSAVYGNVCRCNYGWTALRDDLWIENGTSAFAPHGCYGAGIYVDLGGTASLYDTLPGGFTIYRNICYSNGFAGVQHNFGRNAPTKILNNVCDTAYRAGIYLVNINGATTEGQGVEVVNNLFLNGGWYGVDLDMHGVTNVPDGWVIDYNAYRGNWRALHWGSVAGGHTYSNAADVCASTVFEPHGTDCTGRVVYDAARFDYRGVSGSMLIDSGRDACSPTISNLIASVPFPRHGAHYDIGRYEFFADVPFLDVTTTPCTVQMPVNTIALAGTNAGVVGTMWWTNQHAAAGGVLPAAPAWSIASIPLVYGTNMISVTGTNAAGDACSDGVAIELIPEPASIWQCVLIVAGIVRRMRLAPHVN